MTGELLPGGDPRKWVQVATAIGGQIISGDRRPCSPLAPPRDRGGSRGDAGHRDAGLRGPGRAGLGPHRAGRLLRRYVVQLHGAPRSRPAGGAAPASKTRGGQGLPTARTAAPWPCRVRAETGRPVSYDSRPESRPPARRGEVKRGRQHPIRKGTVMTGTIALMPGIPAAAQRKGGKIDALDLEEIYPPGGGA